MMTHRLTVSQSPIGVWIKVLVSKALHMTTNRRTSSSTTMLQKKTVNSKWRAAGLLWVCMISVQLRFQIGLTSAQLRNTWMSLRINFILDRLTNGSITSEECPNSFLNLELMRFRWCLHKLRPMTLQSMRLTKAYFYSSSLWFQTFPTLIKSERTRS